MEPPQGAERTGPEVGVGGEVWPMGIDLPDEGGATVHRRPRLHRCCQGGLLLTSLEACHAHGKAGNEGQYLDGIILTPLVASLGGLLPKYKACRDSAGVLQAKVAPVILTNPASDQILHQAITLRVTCQRGC